MYVFFLIYVDIYIFNKQQLVTIPETPDIEEPELPTLPFPIAPPKTTNKDKGLRRNQKTQQAERKQVVGWAVEDVLTGQRWEFSEDTSWETFKKALGLEEGLWIWYEVTGANRETILSAEDEFDTMRKLAISSQASSRECVRIRFSNFSDFQNESETQGGSDFNDILL